MKLLLIHNYYGSETPSGENQVFEAEKKLLEDNGHEVLLLTRHSDELRDKGIGGLLKGALVTAWNPCAAAHTRRTVDQFQPDVVHVHNTFPLLSPAIFRAIGNRAAKVLTLHNYRLFCPAAIPMCKGEVCTQCLDKNTKIPSLIYGCYRNSRLATLPVALCGALHKAFGTWKRYVDAFIVLSEFQKRLMIKAGLPAARVHVKPNFFAGTPTPISWEDRDNYAVFAGRLSEEKGVQQLVEAWVKWGEQAPELRILGDGPLRQSLEDKAASSTRIRFLEQLEQSEAESQIARAKLLILPSIWFEGFPMVIREAFAFGTPAAVSNLGPLPSIVENGKNGLVFEPGSPDSLLQTVRANWNDDRLKHLGQTARKEYETWYTEDANYQMLMDIYEKALQQRTGGE